MAKTIDFDKHFAQYTRAWYQKNQQKYKNVDEMEAMMPEIYQQWLETPAEWLGGKTPGGFFAEYQDAEALVQWLENYLRGGKAIPDPLMDAIVDRGAEASAPLCTLLEAAFKLEKPDWVILLVDLLKETGSCGPVDTYLSFITALDAEHEHDETRAMVDTMTDAMADAEPPVEAAKLLAAAKETKLAYTRMALLDILAHRPGEPGVLEHLLEGLNDREYCGIYAALLGVFGDPAAIPTLKAALDWPHIGYRDYLEVRDAIEELGEDVRHKREFAGDPEYEALNKLRRAEPKPAGK